jgi:hypothetical protein
MKTSGDHYRNYQDDRNTQSQETVYTTSNGVPMPHPYETQRVGENGPLLLQDFHLIDLISHFDRERILERVVYTKGSLPMESTKLHMLLMTYVWQTCSRRARNVLSLSAFRPWEASPALMAVPVILAASP